MDSLRRHMRLDAYGACQFSVGNHDLPIASKKARALLAYLVFAQGKHHHRDTLAELLWPEVEIKPARASLRQTIFLLRKTLNAAGCNILQASTSAVQIDHKGIVTDHDDVLSRLRAGKIRDRHTLDPFVQERFLTDLDGIGYGFDNWLAEVRRTSAMGLLRTLKEALMDTGLARETRIELAQASLVRDSFDEQSVRVLMQLYFEQNEIHSAIRVYSDFYQHLEDELDVEPSAETQNLAVSIKLAAPEPAHPPAVVAATVAVLPFETLGPGVTDDFAILALLDQVTCELARLRSINVISSNSTRVYLNRTQNLTQLRDTLGVKYVVVGNLRERAGRVAITVQIVDTQTQQILDARVHEGALEELLSFHSNIAAGIANSIAPNLDRAELDRTRNVPVKMLGPYHLVMKAKEAIFALSRDDFDAAGRYLDEAIDKAPYFAPAQALKAEWHSICIWQRWSKDNEADSQALEACARRAIALSPDEPRVMALLGHNRVLMHRRFDEAESLFKRALALFPNDAETLIWTVPALTFMGHADQAVAHGTHALALSPLDPFLFRNQHFLAIAYYAIGEHDRSADLGLMCFQKNPNYISNIRMTVAALQAADRQDEIPPLLARHQKLLPDFNLRNYGDGPPFRQPEMRDRLLADLKAGGLPV